MLLSRDDLRARGIAYCNGSLLRMEAEGRFPRRVRPSPKRVAWVAAEIDDYLARLAQSRVAA